MTKKEYSMEDGACFDKSKKILAHRVLNPKVPENSPQRYLCYNTRDCELRLIFENMRYCKYRD
ncbi:MAG: hypothetical protein PF569_06610 [Candidatus Woesearchaeota archaeon]|jgi:hypothetical protein|nr:hypothetical protein [Candidatus Woesearchaeota archaeon]